MFRIFDEIWEGLRLIGSFLADHTSLRFAMLGVFAPFLGLPILILLYLPKFARLLTSFAAKALHVAQTQYSVMEQMEDLGSSAGFDALSIIFFLNTVAPVAEAFMGAGLCWGCWLAVKGYRLVKSWIPTVAT